MSDSWQETITQAQILRRHLHAHPELGWKEQATAATIRDYLSQYHIPWRPCAGTGTVACISPTTDSSARQRSIALRADIDALPIHEASQREWASSHDGCMHACGHDGHTAVLLAVARLLKQFQTHLARPITLIFQPAEEGGHGAREMIADGALEGVEAIYGWHNWPAIPFGKLVCPDHLVMCGNGTFTIRVKGKGGHASQPEMCADPVLAASAITLALQQVVSRRLAPQQPAVVSVTSIEAPSAPTVIPASAVIGGSIRVPDQVARDRITAAITEVSQSTAAAYGVSCEVEHVPRYQATINHPQQAHQVRDSWRHCFGDEFLESALPLPVMASEDFSYYLQAIPGAFALIGSNDGDHCHQVSCHNPEYDFNDALIPRVVEWFLTLAGLSSSMYR